MVTGKPVLLGRHSECELLDCLLEAARHGRGAVLDGHTKDMLFDLYEQVSYLSSAFTLQVGDVISTGTPSGIAWHHPGMYLKPGDTVRVEIDKIGTLENPVIAEPR
jgi:2-keto-4-pentenoate hydratase/2-oxohepta-3-ene-1,7-dioic acid hydratase in catechol pathway